MAIERPAEFEMLEQEILRMCEGIPLAIKTIGGLLNTSTDMPVYQLRSYAHTLLEEIRNEGGNLPTLKLHYDQLPQHLKRCFTYYSLFPKNNMFDKQTLVQLWIAQGFIPIQRELLIEDVGDKSFMELIKRGFLQGVEEDYWGNARSCKMQNLYHDFAKSIVGSESCSIGLDEVLDTARIHHVLCSIVEDSSWEVLTHIPYPKKLHTLFLLIQQYNANESMCNKTISRFKRLRVLGLDGFLMKKVPSSIGKLRLLRYLDLSNNKFDSLPECICKLYNLLTLKLNGCEDLKELPRGTRNLVSLRHLHIESCWELSHMPLGLGQLTSLQTLTNFILGRSKSTSARLCELESLDNLRGGFRIEGLKGSIVETRKKNPNNYYLSRMIFLDSLLLKWDWDYDHSGVKNEDELLQFESLRPNLNLKKLEIKNYGGVRFPSWMVFNNIASSLPNIVEISLWECHGCQHLPLGLLPSLQVLIHGHMDSLEYIYDDEEEDFVSLCDYYPSSSSSSLKARGLYPSLKKLHLCKLKQLKGLGRTTRGKEVVPAETASSSSAGKQLMVTSSFGTTQHLAALEVLHITSCPLLDLLADDGIQFQSFSSLTILSITDMPKLVSLPVGLQYLTTLQCLSIEKCQNLISLPDYLRRLTVLLELDIIQCPKLIKRCQKETGEDWPKIAHIPRITMKD